MFDLITLTSFYFFTAGVSLIWYLIGRWKGGIYWFWMWTGVVTMGVIAYEAFGYFHTPLWVGLVPIPILGYFVGRWTPKIDHKITMTRMITKSGTGEPLALKTKWEARLMVIFYTVIGAVCSFGVHLWAW